MDPLNNGTGSAVADQPNDADAIFASRLEGMDFSTGRPEPKPGEEPAQNNADAKGGDAGQQRGAVDAGTQKQGSEGKAATPKPAEQKPSAVNSDAGKTNKQPSRFEARIQELNDKAKAEAARANASEARVKELEAQLSKGGTQPQNPSEPRAIVPKPEKPQYTLEQLRAAKAQAKIDGDDRLADWCDDKIQEAREYETKLKLWEIENGNAVKTAEHNRSYYIKTALEQWPDLGKADSEMTKTYENLSQRFPELANRPQGDGHYYLANVAHLITTAKNHASELAARDEQIKQLTGELEGLKNKMQPKTGSASGSVGGGASEKRTPEDILNMIPDNYGS